MERYKRTLVRLLILALAATGLSILAAANNPAAAQGSTGSPIVRVEVFARGDTGTEQLELRLAGRTVSTFTLTTDLREYSYETSLPIGARDLAVHYVNNAATANGNRAATIDRVVVNDFQFQTEASTVEQLGAFREGSCGRVGNHRSETLVCNGFARFDIGTAGTPRAPIAPGRARPDVAFPKAGHNGQVGCVENCRVVGFQDFDGKRDFVVENLIITNPGGPCLSLRGSHNITVRNVTMRNCGSQKNSNLSNKKIVNITASSNITITNSLFTDNASRQVSNHDLIKLTNSTNVEIINNEFRNLASATNESGPDSGNRTILVTGSNTANVTITRNSFYSPGRNAIQFTRARRLEGIRISHNRIEGRAAWDSDFEDMINLFSTTGHPDDPILIRKNYLRNGGPSPTGTAIILGDGRDSLGTGNVRVADNVIVDPGHVGINVVSGFNFTVKNNIIYGGGDVGLWTATGLVVHHHRFTPACRDHSVFNNRVFFNNQFPQHNGTNHTWIPGTCTNNVRIHSNQFGDRSLSYAVWDL